MEACIYAFKKRCMYVCCLYLVERTHFPLKIGQTGPADGMSTPQTDGQPALRFEGILANGATEILSPLRSLNWHGVRRGREKGGRIGWGVGWWGRKGVETALKVDNKRHW